MVTVGAVPVYMPGLLIRPLGSIDLRLRISHGLLTGLLCLLNGELLLRLLRSHSSSLFSCNLCKRG